MEIKRYYKDKRESQLTLSRVDCFSASSAVTKSSSANSEFIAPRVYDKVSPDADVSHYLVV